jgi:hypothetical protein
MLELCGDSLCIIRKEAEKGLLLLGVGEDWEEVRLIKKREKCRFLERKDILENSCFCARIGINKKKGQRIFLCPFNLICE